MVDPSPSFAYNGGTVDEKESMAASSAQYAELDSIDGVDSVTWTIVRTDDSSDVGDITLTPSGSVGQRVDFTSPVAGKSGALQAEVNGGIAPSIGADSDAMRRVVKFFVPTALGGEVANDGEQDETILETDSSSGICKIINSLVRNASGKLQVNADAGARPTDGDANYRNGAAVQCFDNGDVNSVRIWEFNSADDLYIGDGANTDNIINNCSDTWAAQIGGTARVAVNTVGLGFFATAPVSKPAVTGSKGGNAALASLLTALSNLGLITDSSS